MAFTGVVTSLIGCAAALGYMLDRFAGWAFRRRQEKAPVSKNSEK